jgi:hypothetical protein
MTWYHYLSVQSDCINPTATYSKAGCRCNDRTHTPGSTHAEEEVFSFLFQTVQINAQGRKNFFPNGGGLLNLSVYLLT